MNKEEREKLIAKFCKQGCSNCSAGACPILQHNKVAGNSLGKESLQTPPGSIETVDEGNGLMCR